MKIKTATVSADIIASTTLTADDRILLESQLTELLYTLVQRFGEKKIYARLLKGDYIECVLLQPKYALRVALILKSFVKSFKLDTDIRSRKMRLFKEYGIRIAVALGELTVFNREKGIIDGEAIYLSGRAVNEMSFNAKSTGNNLVFRSNVEKLNILFDANFYLLDTLFAGITRAQSKIIHYKLLGKTEKEITEILKLKQPTINKQANTAGWSAIENAVLAFEKTIK